MRKASLTKAETSDRLHWPQHRMMRQPLKPWLIHEASLTKRLRAQFDDFNVRLIKSSHGVPNLDEIGLIASRKKQNNLIREVLLYGGAEPVVFAHTVMPLRGIKRGWPNFFLQGNRPLGETLFSNPKIKRTAIAFKRLNLHHPLYQQALSALALQEEVLREKVLWARRSAYVFNRHVTGTQSYKMQLVVTEVFLPKLKSKKT